MRDALILVFALVAPVALVLSTSSTSPSASAAPSCNIVGSPMRDVVAGGKGGEVICVLGGNDYVHANGGRDRVRGGNGIDALVGGGGRDTLKGGPGEDRLFATDQRANDVVRGGGGYDHCFADKGDLVRGCEQVHRGNVGATTEALTANSFDVTEIAEDALEVSPLPPGGVPTQPPGATFPPCTPPPGETNPAPCPGG